jgi:uncharacterized protein YidB (DUF937 family)
MGMFDDALNKSVPGGNLTKPLVIAAGALMLAKWLGGKSADQSQPDIMPPTKAPPSPQAAPWGSGKPQTIDVNHSDEGLSGALGGLLDKLRNGGLADAANSWVATGPNKPVQPGQLNSALGSTTVSDLAKKAGVSEQELLDLLAQSLPGLVDHMTPQGRVPTQDEINRYGR